MTAVASNISTRGGVSDWRACYVLDPAAARPVQFVRLDYEIQTVTTAIRRSELPDAFADDLEHSGAPAKIQY
jgi:hypothetical protein